jgi:hypothetical protein
MLADKRAHADSRFQEIGAECRPIVNRAGWRKRDGDSWLYLVLPETWGREVVAGMDTREAAGALRRAGFLVPQSDSDTRHSRMERVGLSKPIRVYVVRDTILAGEVDG